MYPINPAVSLIFTCLANQQGLIDLLSDQFNWWLIIAFITTLQMNHETCAGSRPG